MAAYDFNGKVALVTGGGSGIGRAICRLLARDGARVLVTDINLHTAQETVSLLPGGGDHLALAMDVTDKDCVEAVLKQSQAKYGVPPALLVNNAGVCLPDYDEKERVDYMINVNLKAVLTVSQLFAQQLGKDEDGQAAIVNIGSILGKVGKPTSAAYSACKAGINALTKSFAAELAPKGVRANCVLPGRIDTPMQVGPDDKDYTEYLVNNTPLGRIGRPEEVAEVVVFLLSERSSYMTGACVEVTGGFMM